MKLLRIEMIHYAQEDIEAFDSLCKRWLTNHADVQNLITVHYEAYHQYVEWLFSGNLPTFNLQRHGEVFFDGIACVIAEYIMETREMMMIRQIISKEFNYHLSVDKDKIEQYCQAMLCSSKDDMSHAHREKRLETLMRDIKKYISEYTDINITGIVHFRLPSYVQELKEVVEYAVDEYVMDQHYNDFIALLQHFVFVQEPKMPLVHILHHNDELELVDERMQPIKKNELIEQDLNDLSEEEETEDMVVSTLISTAPERIIIHTVHPEYQVISTLKQIFESRIHMCTDCKICQPSMKKKTLKDSVFHH